MKIQFTKEWELPEDVLSALQLLATTQVILFAIHYRGESSQKVLYFKDLHVALEGYMTHPDAASLSLVISKNLKADRS